jgi:hypothetical protein
MNKPHPLPLSNWRGEFLPPYWGGLGWGYCFSPERGRFNSTGQRPVKNANPPALFFSSRQKGRKGLKKFPAGIFPCSLFFVHCSIIISSLREFFLILCSLFLVPCSLFFFTNFKNFITFTFHSCNHLVKKRLHT